MLLIFVSSDFAARSCLVTADNTVKLGDYGLTRQMFKARRTKNISLCWFYYFTPLPLPSPPTHSSPHHRRTIILVIQNNGHGLFAGWLQSRLWYRAETSSTPSLPQWLETFG